MQEWLIMLKLSGKFSSLPLLTFKYDFYFEMNFVINFVIVGIFIFFLDFFSNFRSPLSIGLPLFA